MTVGYGSPFAACVGPPKKPVIDGTLLEELSEMACLENQACARKVALAATIWDSCIHQNVQVGEHIMDAGNYAASETAKVLRCSKTVADTFAEIGMDLRLRLPAVKAAFDAGELDLARVRVIYRTTGSYSLVTAQRAEAEVLHAARRLSPGPLATEISATMQRIAPEETAELRKDLARLTRVRYRDRDMIATIEADLEADEAAACWQLINEMAATVCARDPRTRGQRLAAAYSALMRREEYVACTCEDDGDQPCTARRELPDRRAPLTSVTVDLATLAGLSDLPAYLAGHGLIDAEYARELASNGDWQLILLEAFDLAEKLGFAPAGDSTSPSSDTTSSDTNSSDTNSSDEANISAEAKNAREAESSSDAENARGETRENEADGGRSTGGRVGGAFVSSGQCRAGAGGPTVFSPLGRGRRRRGLRLPKPSITSKSNTSGSRSSSTHRGGSGTAGTDGVEQYDGPYSFIAALEAAIAADPTLARAVHVDGHGGFTEPPPGALSYRPGRALADSVRHRDRTCRHPGCDVAAVSCEIDHIVPYSHRNPAYGGWTVLSNLHCLCRYHHMLKTMGVWIPTMLAGGVDYWVSSSGSTAVTLPGNHIGTGDMSDGSLLPYIPRKRRTECGGETSHTFTAPARDADAGSPEDDPAPF